MSSGALLFVRLMAWLGVFHLALTPLIFAGPMDRFFTDGSVRDLAPGDFRLALIFWVVSGAALVLLGVSIADEIRAGKARKAGLLLGAIALASLAATILHPVSGFPALLAVSAPAALASLRGGSRDGDRALPRPESPAPIPRGS